MDLILLLEKAADLFNPETPKNIMQFKSFSGMLSYYHRHLSNLALSNCCTNFYVKR